MPLGRKICGETFAGSLNATVPFEAESAAYIVASRLNSTVQFSPYLDQHLTANGQVPPMSFDRVLKTGKELEDMGAKHLPLRQP